MDFVTDLEEVQDFGKFRAIISPKKVTIQTSYILIFYNTLRLYKLVNML